MTYDPKTLDYAQPSINRLAAASRTRNDNSVEINGFKERIVSLQFQIDEKEELIQHLLFVVRTAKHADEFNTVREFEALWRHEKGLVKALKNNRNRLRNKILSTAE